MPWCSRWDSDKMCTCIHVYKYIYILYNILCIHKLYIWVLRVSTAMHNSLMWTGTHWPRSCHFWRPHVPFNRSGEKWPRPVPFTETCQDWMWLGPPGYAGAPATSWEHMAACSLTKDRAYSAPRSRLNNKLTMHSVVLEKCKNKKQTKPLSDQEFLNWVHYFIIIMG